MLIELDIHGDNCWLQQERERKKHFWGFCQLSCLRCVVVVSFHQREILSSLSKKPLRDFFFLLEIVCPYQHRTLAPLISIFEGESVVVVLLRASRNGVRSRDCAITIGRLFLFPLLRPRLLSTQQAIFHSPRNYQKIPASC